MVDKNRLFWMKLPVDFFNRNEILLIEKMKNGANFILFFLKILLKSIEKNGELRASETIFFDEKMLASITNTPIKTVQQAIPILQDLELLKVLENGAFFIPDAVHMMGSETKWAAYKRNGKELENFQFNSKKFPIDIEIDIEKDIEKRKKENVKEKKNTHGEYKNVLLSDAELAKLKDEFSDFADRIERLSSYMASTGKKYKSHYATIKRWAQQDRPKQQTKRVYDDPEAFFQEG